MRRPAILLLGFTLFALALMPITSLAEAAGPEHVIFGTVEDLEGVGMSGVDIMAENTDNGSILQSVTGDAGIFELILPDGFYNVSAVMAGQASNTTYRMLQVASNVYGVDFTIQVVTGRVEGHVSSEGSPVVGAQVALSNGNYTYLGTTTYPLGGYSITGVVPGVYVARSEMVGYWTNVSQEPVRVIENDVTELDFVLEPQPAHVFGKVTVNAVPEEGVSAKLMADGVEVRGAITDANGNYSFSNIIAGEYQVVFSKEGLVEKTYPISIAPFEDKELSVSMVPDGSSGGNGFIDGLDLTHSMMVVALIVVLLMMALAIAVRIRVIKRPEILAREEVEKEEDASELVKEK